MIAEQWENGAAWLAAFGVPRSAPPGPGTLPRAAPLGGSSGWALEVVAVPSGWRPALSGGPDCLIVLDGALDNRPELCARLSGGESVTDADLVARAYRRWGEEAVVLLRGVFALLIWDPARDLLLCARDPLGVHPLFYADTGRALLLSPSIASLLGHPDVGCEIDRGCLVDRLSRRWLEREATCFSHVKRVPPGHVMRVGRDGRRLTRYWHPAPPGRAFAWVPDGEVAERFPVALERAARRCLEPGPAGVYLSGGLDSATVATVAADLCRRAGAAAPWALALAFPGLDRDESAVQHGVAAALGLPLHQLGCEEAAGPRGTLAAALALTRTTPAPLSLIWRPALMRLAVHAQEQGCRVILTGDGADEWLHENPLLVADFLRACRLGSVYRIWRSYARSYHFSRREVTRMLLWRYGVRHLLREAWRTGAVRAGVPQFVPRRWRFPWTIDPDPPAWIAPDPTLRAQAARRLEESYPIHGAGSSGDSYYLREIRARLDSPDRSLLQEEAFLQGRRLGVPVRQPFADAELIEFLVRVHPRVRSAGGQAKALLRGPLVRRFPQLGFDRQRKSWLGGPFLAVVASQAGEAWRELGGVRTLAALGVVDPERARALLDDTIAGRGSRAAPGWVWDVLNLEAWARAHC